MIQVCSICGRAVIDKAYVHHARCCYECSLDAAGKITIERHHVWSRANSPAAVNIPGNAHRALHAVGIPRGGDDPLQLIAAVLLTLANAATAVAAYARTQDWPDWIPRLAETLSAGARSGAEWLLIAAGRLEERHGPDWPSELGLPHWRIPS